MQLLLSNCIRKDHTVWKFHYFSVIQILREINFGDPRSAKSAILTLTGSELGFL